MRSIEHHFRWLGQRLPSTGGRRLVVLTGARQTGKTTLARRRYAELRYLNLDAIETREALAALRTDEWARTVGPAVLDEAQKEPKVFDKVKFAYDAGTLDFTVLLGSSRILLLERIRESLAGRAFPYDLWPLMPSEIRHASADEPPRPLADTLLRGELNTLAEEPPILLGADGGERRSAIDHLARWGGMPELVCLDDESRSEWLRAYQTTWLERDLVDLARLSDLLPFRRLQRLAMLRSGELLNFADLSRDSGIAASTARRYLEYLRLSYQVVLLQPWTTNLTSAAVKTPKAYWIDLGLLRQGTGQWGPLTGPLFETLVVSEIHKWCSTMALDVPLSFYRTRSGLEVDLLAETPRGVVGLEMKSGERLTRKHWRSLVRVADSLGSDWAGGGVVYRGDRLELLNPDHNIWAIPVHRLF